VFYGVGFGPLNSTVPVAGRIAVEPAPLAASVQFNIGGVDAPVGFAGLATGIIGLYQFSVTIPRGVESGDQPVEVTVGGELIPQSLYLPVR
jgi:uncharacterized protein (TIGR03437 family)